MQYDPIILPFPAKVTGRRVTAFLDDIWEAARAWCREQNLPYEHGKYQGAPPI